MRVPLHMQQELPGIATAFDEQLMKGYLRAALFGTTTDITVERCTPDKPLYVPGAYCTLQYQVGTRADGTGRVREVTVIGRVFPDRAACAAYMRDKVAPLVRRSCGRPELAMFEAPAATIGALNMIVHVWPIDGVLTTRVAATDP